MIEIEQCKKMMIKAAVYCGSSESLQQIELKADIILKQEGLLLTDLVIPWEVIDDSYVWAAQDEDGGIFAYKTCPKESEDYDGGIWSTETDDYGARLEHIKGVIKSNKPWKETLIRRPEVNPHALVIDWSQIPREYIWAAMDKNQCIYVFTGKPYSRTACWLSNNGDHLEVCQEESLPDIQYWRETLTKRPEGV
jgi:hypothetical protein